MVESTTQTEQILAVAFNQDHQNFTISTQDGFQVFKSFPVKA